MRAEGGISGVSGEKWWGLGGVFCQKREKRSQLLEVILSSAFKVYFEKRSILSSAF